MPFTVSHVAAVLPLRRWLRPEALLPAAVIGAMVPDFGLFVPFWIPRSATHGWLALLSFCLPVGLTAWLLFELLLRPALLEVAPDAWWQQGRARSALPLRAARTWIGAGIAVLAGALTHLAWDAFTHEGAPGVEMLPLLDRLAWQINGHPMALFRMLQHLSSIGGLALVLWVLWRWHRRLARPPGGLPRRLAVRERAAWIGVYLGIPAVATLLAAIQTLHRGEAFYSSSASLARVAEAGMGATAAALVFVSALVRLRAPNPR